MCNVAADAGSVIVSTAARARLQNNVQVANNKTQ